MRMSWGWGDDVRIFVRTWPRMPILVGTAVAVLALGIGATAMAFNFLDAILLRPSPIHDLDRLVSIWTQAPDRRSPPFEVSYPQYREWRVHGRGVFDEVTAMGSINEPHRLMGRGEPTRVRGRVVSDTFFDLLGTRPLLGRTLTAADNVAGAPVLALVMSWGLWQRQFGGDPGVIGAAIRLDDIIYTVVGVMPRDFEYPAGAEVWTAIVPRNPALAEDRRVGWLEVIARVRTGTTMERARAEAHAIVTRGLPAGTPPVDTLFVPLSEEVFGLSRPALGVLMAAALVLLLIACANIGHLLLLRTTMRRRELAVRQALGASRGRLARQQFAEALTLAAAGAVAGLLLAAWSVKALLPFVPVAIPGLHHVGMNLRTIIVGGLAALAAAAIISAVPIAVVSIRALAETLKASAASTTESRGGRRVRRGLMLVQVALAVIVLVSGGLLARSALAVRQIDLGFDPANVLTMNVELDDANYERLLLRVRQLPGVRAAGAVYLAPLEFGPIGMDAPIILDGQPIAPASYGRNPSVNWEAATPGYFEAIGLPLLEGRLFDERDSASAPPVVIVGERLARYLAPDGRAVGRRLITLDGPKDAAGAPMWQTVVGVVKDGRYRELTDTRFDVYLPHTQTPVPVKHLVVRGGEDARALMTPIREIVRALDAGATLDGIVPLEAIVTRARAGWMFNALIFTLFALLSLLLVAVGLFGLLALAVAGRTREIGIRLSLGAPRRSIARATLREGMTVTLAGLVIGLTSAWLGAHALESLLFGVVARDAVTFVAAPALVLAICGLASWWPARAAMAVTPLVALRRE